jgi:uncharacterized protein (DUF362 family)
MKRREFLRRGVGVSIIAGGYVLGGGAERIFASPFLNPAPANFDLVAVKGGEPTAMFEQGIKALGGIGAFVKKGQTVVVKPNIGWDVGPERAANTNPALVAHMIRACREAGAKKVFVFDHTCDQWQRCYMHSGIESSVKDSGGTIAPGDSEGYYHEVTVPNAKNLGKAKVHELILESDVFINVPILKNHDSTRLTMSMKNLMGIVWDRREWHANDVNQCIADFAAYRKPDLNVLDAYLVMKENGPRGVSVGDVITMKALLLSTDMVAIDAAGAKLFGAEPSEIRHIQLAAQQKVGRMDLEKLNIKRITV